MNNSTFVSYPVTLIYKKDDEAAHWIIIRKTLLAKLPNSSVQLVCNLICTVKHPREDRRDLQSQPTKVHLQRNCYYIQFQQVES